MTDHRGRAAVMAGLVAAAVAALAFEGGGKAGDAIDLTGAWTVSVEGDVSLTCTVDAQQVGTALMAQLTCPGVRETPLEGSVNPQTRSVLLDLSGESGLDVELHGTASEDGGAVDGTWEWSGGRFAGTFHAVRGVEPPQVPDLNGTWLIETSKDGLELCTATIQQDGGTINLDLQCPDQPDANLTGAIDNRMLTLTGDRYEKVTAVVSPDGLAFGGTWFTSSTSQFGPFTGLRLAEHAFAGDVTGDWQITLTGGLLGSCEVAAQQLGSQVFAAFDCGPAGGWWVRGLIDEATSTFTLGGEAGSLRDYRARIRGVLSEDGRSFTAAFVASRDQGSSWGGGAGTLSGQQLDSSPNLLDVAGDYEIRLTSQFGEQVVCQVDLGQAKEILTSAAGCSGVGQGTLDGWLSQLTGAFELQGDLADVVLTLEGTATDGGVTTLEGTWMSDRRFVEGCFTTSLPVDCEAAGRSPAGDATCDSRTDSLDAAVVLQVSAGLLRIEDLCNEGEGVYRLRLQCCPVVINSLDAAIILQIDAGLFGRLAG